MCGLTVQAGWRMTLAAGVACAALFAANAAAAQTRDVNFAVVGKHAGYEQVGERAPERQFYSFFSEIFLAEQNGAKVAFDSVDPMQDLVVNYTPFESGRADPREICDDMIFVILRDEDDYKVDHSGRPFQGQRFMLWSDTRRVIPASALAPASRYTLSVEHATLEETARGAGVPVMSTRAVTTALEIHTLPPQGSAA